MGAVARSYYCLAPEIAGSGGDIDRRADIYSIGVVLFELLTGTPPSESFEMPSALRQRLPAGIDQVVARLRELGTRSNGASN